MVGDRIGFTLGIDARLINHPGIGRYIENLLRVLPKCLEIVAIVNADQRAIVAQARSSARILETSVEPFTLKEQFILPYIIRQADLDVFHSTQFNIPLLWNGSLVVTIHDCAYNRYPEEFSNRNPLAKSYYSFMMNRVSRHADRIIAVSQQTKSDLERFYGITSDDVRVIPHGVTRHQLPEAPPEDVPSAKFLLHVGTARPRKNLEGLLRGYATAITRVDNLPDLILIGKHDERFLDVDELAFELGIEDRIHELGYLSDDLLWWYYTNAVALIFPSLYEGFGFPILEAMSVGTPVITSNTPPLSDIAEEAAVLINPRSSKDIGEAIIDVITSERLQRKLERRGRRQAKKFTWEKTGVTTAKIYASSLKYI